MYLERRPIQPDTSIRFHFGVIIDRPGLSLIPVLLHGNSLSDTIVV